MFVLLFSTLFLLFVALALNVLKSILNNNMVLGGVLNFLSKLDICGMDVPLSINDPVIHLSAFLFK